VLLVDQIELILADMLGAELLQGGPKILGKLGDTAEIGLNRVRGIVVQLQVFQHPLT
jgi:hypothetical protein